MRINYLSPEGVLEVEQGALREIERRLSSSWVGYAAFQLVERGSSKPLDLDLVILTKNRILVVELKNWSGDVEYSNSQWFHKGVPHKSPVVVNNGKVRVLQKVLRGKLPGTDLPHIESLIVLCHPQCRLIKFPEAERQFVLTLNDFCSIASDKNRYESRFPNTLPGHRNPSANPIPDRQRYDGFFSLQNPQVLQRRTVLHGFEQVSQTPDYVHPRRVWSEYRAEHTEVRRSKALLRKWDFQSLAGGSSTAAERATIGLREMRLNEALRAQAPELHEDLLEPVASATPGDVTTNFIEAYRLPERVERLGELLARRPDLSVEERIALAKSALARFAKLHTLGIAHRDITKKTLWVVEPSRIILSTFAAARVPESQTVGVHRLELETGSIMLPEDADCPQHLTANEPFARDVFLLGVLVYELVEGDELERVNSVPLYDAKRNLSISVLGPWYERAMEWAPAARFKTAQEALDALNDALTAESGPVVNEEDIAAFKTNASPLNLPPKGELPSPPGKSVYVSEREGTKVLVKCWPALRYDGKQPARNARLLGFLQQARSLRQSGFDAAPEIVDFGMSQFGLMLVTRWEDGELLKDWLASGAESRERGIVALSLLNAVRRLHAIGLSHGDLKEANIVVGKEADGMPRAVLLDVPDLSADGDIGVTIGALPAHLEAAAPQHRDVFAAIQLARSMLSESDFPRARDESERALELGDVMPPIDLLVETLQAELFPQSDGRLEFRVALKQRGRDVEPSWELEGDNGSFPVGVASDEPTGNLVFFVSGLRRQLIIKFDQAAQVVADVRVREIGHDLYVTAARRSSFRLHADIVIEHGQSGDASALAQVLYERSLAARSDDANYPAAPAVDPYVTGAQNAAVRTLRASELWSALASTDELNAIAITLRAGARVDPGTRGQWVVPFDVESGVIDFSEGERIELLERGTDPIDGSQRWYKVGVVSPDIGKDVMRVDATSMRFQPSEGRTFYIRGALERTASQRRVEAMRRTLANGALIPRLADYFDPDANLEPRQVSLSDIGSLEQYDLNSQQEEALRTALSFGPLSLLQGPPGTGKTKFIASFVHLVLAKGLGRNVLLVSQSHEAVNNALEKVAELADSNGMDISMVRVGLPSMVSSRLLAVQEDSRRQTYRESFDAELKARVRVAGYAMGLPRGYVDAAVDIHMSLGSVLQRIQRLEAGVNPGSEGLDSNQPAMHLARMREVFCEIAESRFGFTVNSRSDLAEVLEDQLARLADDHDSPSPERCHRLAELVELSREFSHVLRNPRANFTSFLARSASVVAGTCVGVGKQTLGIVDHAYDWVIVDEAARASPMELVVAIQAGRRVLLVGDHLQLPPSYPVAVEEKTAQLLGISRSEFRRINNFQRAFSSSYGRKVGRTLLMQYRMASSINRVVSNSFYKGTLEVAREAPGPEYDYLPEVLSRQMIWLDTADQGRQAFHKPAGTHEGALINEVEANAIVSVVRSIAKSPEFLAAIRRKDAHGHIPIGIIAMYAAQRDLIRRKLDQADWAAEIRDLYTVGTVDSYQGKENRIIMLSVVRNDTDRSIGFLSDPERINVAMSRARDRLIVVSSSAMWSGRPNTPMFTVLSEVKKLAELDEALFVPSLDLKRRDENA